MVLTNEIKKIIYSSGNFHIFALKDGTKVKYEGIMPIDFKQGKYVKIDGDFVMDKRYGQTFVCKSIEEAEKSETINFLSLAIDGIGEKKANEILNEVGSYKVFEKEPFKIFDYFLSKSSKDILEQIRNKRSLFISDDKEFIAKQINKEIKGLGTKKVLSWIEDYEKDNLYNTSNFLSDENLIKYLASDTALKIYEQIKHIGDLERDYKELLSLKIPDYCITYLFKDYGFDTFKNVAINPYILLSYGLIFPVVDEIALKRFGMERDCYSRIINGLLYILKENEKNGNTFMEKDECIKRTSLILDLSKEEVLEKCDAEIARKEEPEFIQKDEKLYRRIIFFTERKLGIMISDKIKEKDNFIPGEIIKYLKTTKLSEKQQNAVLGVLRKKISILTGGPGTGKTTTINEVCNCLNKLNKKYLLAAPTGRASKRMSESTGREAQTLHRLLEYKPRGAFGSFMRNEKYPLWADYVIIDESSMLDVYMLNNLIKAIKFGTSVIFVGDIDQLPSISMGSVLMDMKDSGKVPVFELTEIFRQGMDSFIVRNAYHIKNNETLETNEDDFIYKKVSSYEDVKCELEKLNFDYQILCPMRVGNLGTIKINQLMQEIKNSGAKKQVFSAGKMLKVDDKIIQNDNDYNKEIYNGEIGTIIDIDAENCTIKYPYNNPEIIKYKISDLYEIDLSYAISIHKSQGSEADNVVLIIDGNPDFLSKELIYTAVTRAKKKIILLSTYDLEFFSKLSSSNNRMTNLNNTIF